MSKSIVSIAKGFDPEKLVVEVLEPLGGVRSLIRPRTTVVIKPNAGHPAAADTSVNTTPELVAALIREVRKAEPKEIIVAEAAAMGCDTMECLKVSGILKAAKDAGADRIVDIKSDEDLINVPIRDARSAINKMRLPRFLIEAEHIINLPIFKSHCSMVFTCALKNMKGVVQDKVHYQMHQTNLAEAMMDLWSIIKADLNIADLIRPAEGFGPHNTLPVNLGCLIAGKDPVALDATACRIVGLDIDQVAYFGPARDRGLGNFDEAMIEIRGKQIEDVYRPMWLPYLESLEKYPEYTIDTEGACSSCLSLVGLTMEKLKALGQYDENAGKTILVGAKKRVPEDIPPDRLILVGDCLRIHRKKGVFVEGCPPGEPNPHWAIVDGYSPAFDLRDPGAGEAIRKRMADETPPFIEHMHLLKAQWDNEQNND
ncbi:MAG: DUF362 domain-containing protein [Deltaproteobacteria bacterium]|nr:DUF362 domain-containing protein [Deltaproteobacteria bacterium]